LVQDQDEPNIFEKKGKLRRRMSNSRPPNTLNYGNKHLLHNTNFFLALI